MSDVNRLLNEQGHSEEHAHMLEAAARAAVKKSEALRRLHEWSGLMRDYHDDNVKLRAALRASRRLSGLLGSLLLSALIALVVLAAIA